MAEFSANVNEKVIFLCLKCILMCMIRDICVYLWMYIF